MLPRNNFHPTSPFAGLQRMFGWRSLVISRSLIDMTAMAPGISTPWLANGRNVANIDIMYVFGLIRLSTLPLSINQPVGASA